ncbi:hypothetical protein HDU84_005164 [Entophlyctis sp. JEL0112]|nr:hypothetical protein HDU84_005164 [Entophlyctis sp. JEL0112]
MNADAARECLAQSRRRAAAGQRDDALRFARKAVALYGGPFAEAEEWLVQLQSAPAPSDDSTSDLPASSQSANNSSTTPPSSTSASDRPQGSSSRRQDQQQRQQATTPEATSTSRPFTQDQVAGIKRIKAMKAKGDLYGILNLEKSCSDSDIKKAYRKLALQFHPDKCNAPGTDEAFKAISHAFTVLGDEGKKEQYDRYGVDPDSRGGGGGGGGMSSGHPFARNFGGRQQGFQEVDPEELFNMFFGGGMDGPGGGDSSMNENNYSWDYGSGYTLKRATSLHNVEYYVNPKMFSEKYDKPQYRWKLSNFEKGIEGQYYRNIYYRCQQEREYKQQMISSSYSLFRGVDQQKLEKAHAYVMPSCVEVDNWNVRAANLKPLGGGSGNDGSSKAKHKAKGSGGSNAVQERKKASEQQRAASVAGTHLHKRLRAIEPRDAIPNSDVFAALEAVRDGSYAARTKKYLGQKYGNPNDEFLGIRVPAIRSIAKANLPSLTKLTLDQLFANAVHDARLCAGLALVEAFKHPAHAIEWLGDLDTADAHSAILATFLEHTAALDNWDLVDATAEIVGEYLMLYHVDALGKFVELAGAVEEASPEANAAKILDTINVLPTFYQDLLVSCDFWQVRIAIVSLLRPIKRGKTDFALHILKHQIYRCSLRAPVGGSVREKVTIRGVPFSDLDLINKACGWMLREVGRISRTKLTLFLDRHAEICSKTTVRYATEHFDKADSRRYVAKAF